MIHTIDYPTELIRRGYHGASQEISHLLSSAKEVGYPLLIKPTHGGGGKGMRVVHNHEVLEEEIMIAKREALKSFGNDEVLLERWLERPRHVEVQVFADGVGGVVSLWERDCSVQRRHQSEFESASGSGVSGPVWSKRVRWGRNTLHHRAGSGD
jgi:3-methylcrotonyl-CoA carboxylase alpha subunit